MGLKSKCNKREWEFIAIEQGIKSVNGELLRGDNRNKRSILNSTELIRFFLKTDQGDKTSPGGGGRRYQQ